MFKVLPSGVLSIPFWIVAYGLFIVPSPALSLPLPDTNTVSTVELSSCNILESDIGVKEID